MNRELDQVHLTCHTHYNGPVSWELMMSGRGCVALGEEKDGTKDVWFGL